MPPVFIQPGLGDSLNRYLERLGRRGAEQRALQAQRDNLQARMDARAAETRTRIISQSLNQSVGLFTDEMQRDRASERRLGEAEELQYLRGKPARQEAYAEFGLVNTYNSELALVNKKTGIDNLLAQAHARFEASANTMSFADKKRRGTATAELQQYASQFSAGDLEQADYVAGTLKALSELDFEPSGPPKQTLKANTMMGRGFGDGGNNLTEGVLFNIDDNGQAEPVETGLEDMIKERMETIFETENPKHYEWNRLDQKEQKGTEEPNEFISYEEAQALLLRDIHTARLAQQVAQGTISPEGLARALLALKGLEQGAPQESATKVAGASAEPTLAGTIDRIGVPAAVSFDLPRKAMDAKVKSNGGKPIAILDERGQPKIVTRKGREYLLMYLGDGQTALVPRPTVPTSPVTPPLSNPEWMP